MTIKEAHSIYYWSRQLKKLNVETGRAVTAGELARAVGQSTNTAKKWLNRAVGARMAVSMEWTFPNGTKGMIYAVKMGE